MHNAKAMAQHLVFEPTVGRSITLNIFLLINLIGKQNEPITETFHRPALVYGLGAGRFTGRMRRWRR
jgi:hypothetical protein